jgi:hypothetical protein
MGAQLLGLPALGQNQAAFADKVRVQLDLLRFQGQQSLVGCLQGLAVFPQ